MRYAAYLIALIFIIALVVPASAQSVTYSCPDGKALEELTIASDSPTTASFSLLMQDGTSMAGSWSYLPSYVYGYPLSNTADISFEGDSDSMDFITPHKLFVNIYSSWNLTSLAQNRWIVGAGQMEGINNIAVEKYGVNSAVVGFTINSDSDVTYTVTETDLNLVNRNLKNTDILDQGYKMLSSVYNFIVNLFNWVKFFFITGLSLVVALYLAVSMAFAARASRGNPGRFFRVFISDMRKLFTFIMEVWRWLIEAVGTLLGWFKVV